MSSPGEVAPVPVAWRLYLWKPSAGRRLRGTRRAAVVLLYILPMLRTEVGSIDGQQGLHGRTAPQSLQFLHPNRGFGLEFKNRWFGIERDGAVWKAPVSRPENPSSDPNTHRKGQVSWHGAPGVTLYLGKVHLVITATQGDRGRGPEGRGVSPPHHPQYIGQPA